MGIVKAELHPLATAFLRECLQRILPIRSGLHDIPITGLGVEHGKAIVVFCRDHDVLHARGPGGLDKLRGIKRDGIKLLRVPTVLPHRNPGIVHDPLAEPLDLPVVIPSRGHGEYSPVDKHAEFGIPPPCHPTLPLAGALARNRRFHRLVAGTTFSGWSYHNIGRPEHREGEKGKKQCGCVSGKVHCKQLDRRPLRRFGNRICRRTHWWCSSRRLRWRRDRSRRRCNRQPPAWIDSGSRRS